MNTNVNECSFIHLSFEQRIFWIARDEDKSDMKKVYLIKCDKQRMKRKKMIGYKNDNKFLFFFFILSLCLIVIVKRRLSHEDNGIFGQFLKFTRFFLLLVDMSSNFFYLRLKIFQAFWALSLQDRPEGI